MERKEVGRLPAFPSSLLETTPLLRLLVRIPCARPCRRRNYVQRNVQTLLSVRSQHVLVPVQPIDQSREAYCQATTLWPKIPRLCSAVHSLRGRRGAWLIRNLCANVRPHRCALVGARARASIIKMITAYSHHSAHGFDNSNNVLYLDSTSDLDLEWCGAASAEMADVVPAYPIERVPHVAQGTGLAEGAPSSVNALCAPICALYVQHTPFLLAF